MSNKPRCFPNLRTNFIYRSTELPKIVVGRLKVKPSLLGNGQSHRSTAHVRGVGDMALIPDFSLPCLPLALRLLISLAMVGLHSHSKEQREAVRQLLHAVIIRDMSTFNPERFKDWIKDLDVRFRKVGMTMRATISSSRTVHFAIRDVRTKRGAFQFASSSRVQFEDSDVIMSL